MKVLRRGANLLAAPQVNGAATEFSAVKERVKKDMAVLRKEGLGTRAL
jgi:hypothetical protein